MTRLVICVFLISAPVTNSQYIAIASVKKEKKNQKEKEAHWPETGHGPYVGSAFVAASYRLLTWLQLEWENTGSNNLQLALNELAELYGTAQNHHNQGTA